MASHRTGGQLLISTYSLNRESFGRSASNFVRVALTYYTGSPTTFLSPFLLYCTFLVSLCITVFMGYCTLYEEKPLSHFHINLPYYTNFKDEQVICQIGIAVHAFFEKITSTSDKDTVVVMGFNWFTVKLTNYKLCTGHHI